MKEAIRHAMKEDIESISRMAKSNSADLLNNKSGGFLVSNFSYEDYEKYAEHNKHFYVFEEDGEVTAFLLAFTQDELDHKQINKLYKKLGKDKYIVIKQICVKLGKKRKGRGSKLYEFLMGIVDEDIFAAVVLDNPPNKASIQFHRKLGFIELQTIVPEDGKKRGVYFWDNPLREETYNDKSVILSQYEEALKLYLHEDTLNWSKTKNLLYITGGLLAVFAFILNIQLALPKAFYPIAMIIFAAGGIISSTGFCISIWSGIKYMQVRKQSVAMLENILHKMKGIFVVNAGFSDGKMMKRSPTTWVMRLFPIMIILIWIGILIISILFWPQLIVSKM